MTGSRLTRGELGWLLAQEARGAAQALRHGVNELKLRASIAPPPEPAEVPITLTIVEPEEAPPLESSLNALDDAISLLGELEQGRAVQKGRRGRIDLASLICELTPNARITLEPGSGTEVFGDEAELRRLFHVMLAQANPTDTESAELSIKREEGWVRIGVQLGPDSAAFGELERRWVSRMALRHGGRLELESGSLSVLLPADASADQSEVVELRKELEQAQQLGEAYARELAAVFSESGPETPTVNSDVVLITDDVNVGARRFAVLVSLARGVERQLRQLSEGLRADITLAAEEVGESSALSASLQRRLGTTLELAGQLARVAACPAPEAVGRVDVEAIARDVASEIAPFAARREVTVCLSCPPEMRMSTRPKVLGLLLRLLLEHAIMATPRLEEVSLRLAKRGSVLRIEVEDGGPGVPPNALNALLELSIDPSSLGRPTGAQLGAAQTAALYLRGALSLAASSAGRTVIACELGNLGSPSVVPAAS